MEWMCTHEATCLQGLHDWFNSNLVHTYDDSVSAPTMAPIVFVGTHKDMISQTITIRGDLYETK